jgi:hypothetical protein
VKETGNTLWAAYTRLRIGIPVNLWLGVVNMVQNLWVRQKKLKIDLLIRIPFVESNTQLLRRRGTRSRYPSPSSSVRSVPYPVIRQTGLQAASAEAASIRLHYTRSRTQLRDVPSVTGAGDVPPGVVLRRDP